MPEHAVPYLESYTFTEEERSRRLNLAERFIPSKISDALADAVFWIDPDLLPTTPENELEDGEVMEEEVPEEVLEIQGLRRRRAWPWLIGMSRWGYPPGWVASKGTTLPRRLVFPQIHANGLQIPSKPSRSISRVYR